MIAVMLEVRWLSIRTHVYCSTTGIGWHSTRELGRRGSKKWRTGFFFDEESGAVELSWLWPSQVLLGPRSKDLPARSSERRLPSNSLCTTQNLVAFSQVSLRADTFPLEPGKWQPLECSAVRFSFWETMGLPRLSQLSVWR